MKDTKASYAEEQPMPRNSAGFSVYIGGSVGGLVGLIILIAIIYYFCFRR
jgi:hypothetical protein